RDPFQKRERNGKAPPHMLKSAGNPRPGQPTSGLAVEDWQAGVGQKARIQGHSGIGYRSAEDGSMTSPHGYQRLLLLQEADRGGPRSLFRYLKAYGRSGGMSRRKR